MLHCKMSDCSWRIKLLKISSRKLILVTVSQLNNSHGKKKKRWRDLIAPFLHRHIHFLWEGCLPYGWDCCWAAVVHGSTAQGSSFCFCSITFWETCMLELGKFHENPRLWISNSPFRYKRNVWFSSSKWIQHFKRLKLLQWPVFEVL